MSSREQPMSRGHLVAPVAVSEVSLPADARTLSNLSRIDYADAFRLDAGVERTAEQWARAMLEDAPLRKRVQLVSGWFGLGLELGSPWSRRRVLGWEVARNDSGFVLLHADGWLGLQAELLFRAELNGLLFATFVELNNAAARGAWAAITSTHQKVVRSLLEHAARREARR